MKRDLYALLGVKRDASNRELKKAYRDQARRAHPDGGGTTEEFVAVRSAYAVLSDAERRDRYDRTGDESSQDVMTEWSEAVRFILFALENVLQQLTVPVKNANVVGMLRDIILRELHNGIKPNYDKAVRRTEALTEFRARLDVLPGEHENRFLQVLDVHLRQAVQHEQAARGAVRAAERALEELSHYKSDHEIVTWFYGAGVAASGVSQNWVIGG